MDYCLYYQAKVDKSLTWFFVATFRSFEHVGFDRTYNVEDGIFEFFVPQEMEEIFLNIFSYYKNNKIIFDLKKLHNRLID